MRPGVRAGLGGAPSDHTGHEGRRHVGCALPAADHRRPALAAAVPGEEVTRPPCGLPPFFLRSLDPCTSPAALPDLLPGVGGPSTRACAHRGADAGRSLPPATRLSSGLPVTPQPRLRAGPATGRATTWRGHNLACIFPPASLYRRREASGPDLWVLVYFCFLNLE